jgi:hypothetical protein
MIPLGVLGSVQGAAASYSFVTYMSDTTATTSHSFASLSVGSAAANRTVIVAISLYAGTAVSSLTIGGVAATIHLQAWDGVLAGVVIASAALPTGTTATVAFTTSANTTERTVGVWAAYGTLTYSTSGSSNISAPSVTLTAPSAALAIAAYAASNSGATALTGVTQRYGLASFPKYLGGDAQPAPGSHTVTSGGGPNFYNALGVVEFTLT